MSESGVANPAQPARAPGFPENADLLVFDGFTTLNTKPTRTALEDQEMFICDGFMPLGKNNLRTLYGLGDSIYTAPAGTTISFYKFANVGPVAYCFVFPSDGSVHAVNTTTRADTVIAPAWTISNPSPNTTDVAQWGSKYVIIVSDQTNGYFLWDGSIWYAAGSVGPDIVIGSSGYDYTSEPTITAVGGTGSGAVFSTTVKNGYIESVSVVNAGHGYGYTDFVFLAFSGGGSAYATATATATVSGGSITSVSVVSGGAGYTSTTSVALYGGGGFGATAKAIVSGGSITSVSLTNAGQGYTAAVTVVFVDGNNPVAIATASMMPFGVKGTAIESYVQRAWVADGSKILFTAPSSATDFATSAGGGVFPSRDSFLRVGFKALRQTNGFLYLLADSSLNYVSGVSANTDSTTGTVTTTFSNQNVDPQIGSSWPGSVQVFSRNLVFANSFGVQVSYGGAVTKVSLPLDGIYTSVKDFGGVSPSSAVAVVFGIHVYMLLLPVIDQVTKQQTNKLLMWDGKRWWTASQEVSLTWIASQEIDSVLTAWGTDGAKIYPLFQQPSERLTKTVQSKLWDKPSYLFSKMGNRVAGLLSYNAASSNPVSITVDNGTRSTPTTYSQTANAVSWTNNSGEAVSWVNNVGHAFAWGYYGIEVLKPHAITQPGPLLGLTLSTMAGDLTVVSLTLLEQIYQTKI